jgi:hypothetical protein
MVPSRFLTSVAVAALFCALWGYHALTVTAGGNAPPVGPTITSFRSVAEYGDGWTFEGTVTGGTGKVTIYFGNLPCLVGLTTPVNPDGTFSMTITVPPGQSGCGSAQAIDATGNRSIVELCVIC